MRKPFFILAPMDDVTDTVFRRIVSDCAPPDYTVTEFVNVDALCSKGRSRVIRKLGTELDATPVIAQIWGREPENFETIAYEISEGLLGDPEYENWLARGLGSNEALMSSKENRESRTNGTVIETRMQLAQRFVETVRGAISSADGQANGAKFSGIDLNFGCPAKSELKNQCCSALQKPDLRDKALAIIIATQKGAKAGKNKLPVSFKTRLGFDQIDYSWHEFLLEQKPSILTIHVRTTREMSKVPAHWEAIEPIIKLRDEISPDTKIVMNGDIMNRVQGEEIAKKYGVDGIMIGRGVFHDPFCFSRTTHQPDCQLAKLAALPASSDSAHLSSPILTSPYSDTARSVSQKEDAHDLKVRCTCPSLWDSVGRKERIEMLKKHILMHDEIYPNAQRPFNPLKKFAKVYINGFPGAAELRSRIMETESVSEALEVIKSVS